MYPRLLVSHSPAASRGTTRPRSSINDLSKATFMALNVGCALLVLVLPLVLLFALVVGIPFPLPLPFAVERPAVPSALPGERLKWLMMSVTLLPRCLCHTISS